jgi:sugar lactone lactonase YvrE
MNRYGRSNITLQEGWSRNYLIPPSRFFGANGIRGGSDGRIYVAQLAGSRISTIDPESGEIEHLDTTGSEIIGPDDLVFDDDGNLYITEYTEGRVSMRQPNGVTRVLQGDVYGSNPITIHDGRLIVGECRMAARIMELDRCGGAPRIILEDIPMANAFEVGPDGKLYFPVMGTNEIWRVNLDGSGCEVVVGDLGVPDSVKFDDKGQIISTQVGSGQVLRIDPQSGARTVLADIGPGLDNAAFVNSRLFVSHMTGSIHEILAPGQLRELNPQGLLWPMGVAVSDAGSVYVADGSYAYIREPGKMMGLVGMIFTPGFPGFHRGVASAGSCEWYVTTSVGEVQCWNPVSQSSEVLASGYDVLMGIAVDADGAICFAESGAGKVHAMVNGKASVLATGLELPTGLAIGDEGQCFVCESGAGRVVKLENGRSETIADGFELPEGLALFGDKLFVIDVATHQLVSVSLSSGARSVIASGLPVGRPTGSRPVLGSAGEFSGPMTSFAGLAAGADGTLYVGADGDGSVMAISPPI